MTAKRKRLLVVDDDRLIRQILADLLQAELDVVTAAGGAEATELLGRESYDAVLCDQMMPGVTGVEVLRQAFSLQPHAARILMTASDSVQALSDAVNVARVHRFITKPLRVVEVPAIVKGAVHEVELERKNEALVDELQKVVAQVRAREKELERELDVRTRELRDVMEHLMRKSGQ